MITCQKCRALLEPGTRACPYCGTDQRHHRAPSEADDAERTTRFGLWLLGVIVAVYAATVLLDPAKGDKEAASLEPSAVSLRVFGWAEPPRVSHCREYWRLLATAFLHADVIHLLLNCAAIYYLIPIVSRTFGVHRTVCIYFASALAGSLLSHLFANGGVGASGAVCGLIGATAVYGWRRGGALGKALSRSMLGWAAAIALFGILMPRIDNAGHFGGFLGGAALGWVAAGVRARGGLADRVWTLGARGAVAAAILVAAVFWVPSVMRGFERRDVELYRSHANRVLDLIDRVLAAPGSEPLPESFPDGPAGSEAVRDAVREALARAREGGEDAPAALDRAIAAWAEWAEGLYCSHALPPLQ